MSTSEPHRSPGQGRWPSSGTPQAASPPPTRPALMPCPASSPSGSGPRPGGTTTAGSMSSSPPGQTTPQHASPWPAAQPSQASRTRFPPSAGIAGAPRPGRHRMPPLHSSPPHPAAGPGDTFPPATRSASGTASGCPAREHRSSASRLPRHPGCRTPGTPAPPPLHHRAAHLRQDPGTRRPGRACVETPDGSPHRVEPGSVTETSSQALLQAAAYPMPSPPHAPVCGRSRNSPGLRSRNSPGPGLYLFYLMSSFPVGMTRPGRLLGR